MRVRCIGACALSAALLMTSLVAPVSATSLVAEVESFDLYLSEDEATFQFAEFYLPTLIGPDWDDVIRRFPDLVLTIEWSAPVLSRTRYGGSRQPWSAYEVGSGRVTVSAFGPDGPIGMMKGRVDGLTLDVKDVEDEELGDGEWTYAYSGDLKISRGLARYLGVERRSSGFWIDVFPDDEHTSPDEPERHFRMSCCFNVEFGVTPSANGPTPVPEPATPALLLGAATIGWLRSRRRR